MYAFGLSPLLGLPPFISSGRSLTLLLCFLLLTRSVILLGSDLLRALIIAWLDSYRLLLPSFGVLFHVYSFWLFLFTLGFTSPKFVRTYFSCKVLSEDGSDDSSKLSSHQMAHPTLLRTRLPT